MIKRKMKNDKKWDKSRYQCSNCNTSGRRRGKKKEKEKEEEDAEEDKYVLNNTNNHK